MIDFDFGGSLQMMGGIAEALDAAGIEDHVPTHRDRIGSDEAQEVPPADIAWAAPTGRERLELDLRSLVAPEPMVRALAAADALAADATLVVLTPLLPLPLLQLLAERGFHARALPLADGAARVTIRRWPADRHMGVRANGQARA